MNAAEARQKAEGVIYQESKDYIEFVAGMGKLTTDFAPALPPAVAERLSADGYDLKIYRGSHNEISWENAEVGREGTIEYVDEPSDDNDKDDGKNNSEAGKCNDEATKSNSETGKCDGEAGKNNIFETMDEFLKEFFPGKRDGATGKSSLSEAMDEFFKGFGIDKRDGEAGKNNIFETMRERLKGFGTSKCDGETGKSSIPETMTEFLKGLGIGFSEAKDEFLKGVFPGKRDGEDAKCASKGSNSNFFEAAAERKKEDGDEKIDIGSVVGDFFEVLSGVIEEIEKEVCDGKCDTEDCETCDGEGCSCCHGEGDGCCHGEGDGCCNGEGDGCCHGDSDGCCNSEGGKKCEDDVPANSETASETPVDDLHPPEAENTPDSDDSAKDIVEEDAYETDPSKN